MRIYLSTGIVLIVVLAVLAPRVLSDTQANMNQRAAERAATADKAMNVAYTELLSLLDAEGKEKLKTAQRAWLTFRDAECGFAGDFARGGSMSPQLHSWESESLTNDRTEQLKSHVALYKSR